MFKFCFRDSFPELQGGTRELSKIFFDKIPVIRITNDDDILFQKAIGEIQKDYTESKAQELDSLIYDLYNLSDEERKTIGYIEIQ